jgi:hypothetical protein
LKRGHEVARRSDEVFDWGDEMRMMRGLERKA